MRVAVTITQADQRMRADLWAEFADLVRDCISDHSIAIISHTGAVTGPDRYGWVAEYHEPDAPTGKAALNEIAREYQHSINWVGISEAAEVLA